MNVDKKLLFRRNVWHQMLYSVIYLFIKLEKVFSQTYILTEWIILLPVSENAASFKIRVLNCSFFQLTP